MGRITAYKAADGQIFEDRKAYLTHSRDLVAAARIKALVTAQITDAVIAKAVGDFYAANVPALRDLVNSKDISLDGSSTETETEDEEGSGGV